MKKLYFTLYAVIFVCVAGTAIFLIFAPETIPAHYNFLGEVDRFGSKYEAIIFPIFNVLMAVFFLYSAKREHKKEQNGNEKILLYAGLCTLIFFTALGFFFMVKALGNNLKPSVNTMKFINICVGIMLIVLGNIMPKTRRNQNFGIRTKWSLASDAVWQKSHRFGGIFSVICGLLIISLSLLLSEIWNFIVIIAVVAFWLLGTIIASYYFFKKAK